MRGKAGLTSCCPVSVAGARALGSLLSFPAQPSWTLPKGGRLLGGGASCVGCDSGVPRERFALWPFLLLYTVPVPVPGSLRLN